MASGDFGVVWRDREAWDKLCAGTSCPICRERMPRDVVADRPTCWVSAPRMAPLAGYVAVISKRHVVEPFHLSREQGAAFWADVMGVAKSLADLFRPIKMNYEIHGNTVPHLHVHLYPRQPDDPFVGGPIDGRRAFVRRTPAEIERIRQALERTTGSGASHGAH